MPLSGNNILLNILYFISFITGKWILYFWTLCCVGKIYNKELTKERMDSESIDRWIDWVMDLWMVGWAFSWMKGESWINLLAYDIDIVICNKQYIFKKSTYRYINAKIKIKMLVLTE